MANITKLPYPDDSFNFGKNFPVIPIFWKFSDPTLKTLLQQFLQIWNQSAHIAWHESHCPEMIDHGLAHSRNLYMIANRLFHDNDNLIENLNDGEIACFALSLWLHDISMSKTLFSIRDEDLEGLNTFLSGYKICLRQPPKTIVSDKVAIGSLSEITTQWVRSHHHILSKYVIQEDKKNISFGIENDEDLRRILGKLCFSHSSKVRLVKRDEIGEFYNTAPVIEQHNGFERLRIGNEAYSINMLFLGALLRFVDGCDQTKKRLISPGYAAQLHERNRAQRDRLIAELNPQVESADRATLQELKKVSEDSSTQGNKTIKKLPELKIKYPYLKSRFDELEHICRFRENMDYKKSVDDIYFNNGSIVLSLPDDRDEKSEGRVKNDILRELTVVSEILKHPPNTAKDIGIPYCKNTEYNEKSFDVKQYLNSEEYEVPEYEIYQRFGQPGYNQVEYIAQKIHEEYLNKEREKKITVFENYNLHLWNRLSREFRDSNRAPVKVHWQYIHEIGCETLPLSAVTSPKDFSFTQEELERLAEMEHNRWMEEKLKKGWKFGRPRDDSKKNHDLLVPYKELPDIERQKDRDIILNIPVRLRELGMEIVRKESNS
ncbi:MAG: hypothetical protein LUQ31_11220 [Methanoregula sp.]|nr:hypothetical protein [Methanoregula sp.]